jgi:hypothetical protein
MSFKLQELIHKFEEGAGARVVRLVLAVVALIGVAVVYDSFCYRNLATSEGMDNAQLARNIAEGRGFTTMVVRPFSMFLLAKHRDDHSTLIKQGHPDIANAPAYPVLLAPLLKFVPQEDLTNVRNFSVARLDFAIAVLNQALLLLSVLLVFALARRWFDRAVAAMAAVLFAGTELYWRFSISGLSTNLLIAIVLLLALFLTRAEEASRTGSSAGKLMGLGCVVGILLGAAALTRYACAFMAIPVLVFAMLFFQPRRAAFITAMLTTFVLVFAPWIVRNCMVSGAPFGTATYAIMEKTRLFPEDRLQRSFHPDLAPVSLSDYTRKLVTNAREVISSDLPRLGGSWLSALFLAGLLVRFRSPGLARVRWFIILAALTLIPVQALGKTNLASEYGDVTSENLLVLLAPLIGIYATGVFFVFLDSVEFTSFRARYAAWAGFVVVMVLPMILTLLPPHPIPVIYPPYYPPRIQQIGRWLKPGELMMSDVAAGVAWYGERQALVPTLSWGGDFLEINDFQKPINGIYLTTRTTENKFLSNWMRGDRSGWESFLFETLVKHEVPTGFPLKNAPQALFTEGQVLLMDYERWRAGAK